MGVLDALFGAIRAEATNDQFDGIIFITGLLFNIVLSVTITILGDKLGLDLYLAAAFVFCEWSTWHQPCHGGVSAQRGGVWGRNSSRCR
jgi:hypothetical protein